MDNKNHNNNDGNNEYESDNKSTPINEEFNGDFDVVLTLEDLEEESELEIEENEGSYDPDVDDDFTNSEYDDQLKTPTRSLDRADLLKYGPILVFVITLIFFVLPSLLSTGGGTNSSADWNTIEQRLSDAQGYNDDDKESFIEQSETKVDPDARTGNPSASSYVRASALADESELEVLDNLNLHIYQQANSVNRKQGEQDDSGAQGYKLYEQATRSVFAENPQRLKSLESDHAEMALEIREYYENLSAEMVRLKEKVSALAVESKSVSHQAVNTNFPTRVTPSSVYVLDTANPIITDSFNTHLPDELPTKAGQSFTQDSEALTLNIELPFDGVLLHSTLGNHLNFITSNCERFSRKMGDHLYGFGLIVSLDTTGVNSNSRRFIRRGDYRQCSRSVLLGDVEIRSDSAIIFGVDQGNHNGASSVKQVLGRPSRTSEVVAVPVEVIR